MLKFAIVRNCFRGAITTNAMEHLGSNKQRVKYFPKKRKEQGTEVRLNDTFPISLALARAHTSAHKILMDAFIYEF